MKHIFFLFFLTVCELTQLLESHASVFPPSSHFLKQFPLQPLTHTYQSSYLPVGQTGFLSVHVAMHYDPLPLCLCWHLTFITTWPWLSLLSSLLRCSITLSSWGKHWCQVTVMTFWLSVFMWWMRWKCTTMAKRGWRYAKLTHHRQSEWEQRGVSNKTNIYIYMYSNTDATVINCVTAP